MKYLINGAKKRGKWKLPPKERKPKTEAEKQLISARIMAKKEREARQLETFKGWCEKNGLPEPSAEVMFAKDRGRRWRIDYFFEVGDKKLAIEVEGGVWKMGRHQRPDGFRGDMEKYNAMEEYGIALYRCEPSTLMNFQTAAFVRQHFGLKGPNNHPEHYEKPKGILHPRKRRR